ncbi:urease accessory protein UreE [Tissierella creatinini]|nr:urease accessory protein UreE [Tissierella creatinini]TJX61966.1 urease accessory protein UreE [Soehngenia saccharolytica]
MENGIITRVKGNIREQEFEDLPIDYIDIPWYDSGKRIQKLVTKKGISIGIRLDDENIARGLLQGDVLEVINGEAIVLNIIEEKCITIKLMDLKTVAKVCYEIGNRHSPLFYSEDYSDLILPYDEPMLVMLNKLGVETSVRMMKIHRDRSISSVNTSNHHGHSHDREHSHHHISHEH